MVYLFSNFSFKANSFAESDCLVNNATANGVYGKVSKIPNFEILESKLNLSLQNRIVRDQFLGSGRFRRLPVELRLTRTMWSLIRSFE